MTDGRWFSLGQDDTYYERIRKTGLYARHIYTLLNDLAYTVDESLTREWGDLENFGTARSYQVTRVSLLRSVEEQTVKGQFHRIAWGGPRLTRYEFSFTSAPDAQSLEFSVRPLSSPPSNIHVLIGRNGVGKTKLLRGLAQAVVNPDHPETSGRVSLSRSKVIDDEHRFVNVVSVTFSAFDSLIDTSESPFGAAATHVHIGLNGSYRAHAMAGDGYLGKEFVDSLVEVLSSAQERLWFTCLEMLSRDPYMAKLPIHGQARHLRNSLARDRKNAGPLKADLRKTFSELSSGHAIVLLSITKLVEHVAEQSLVLIDEPESHLHPPLLASFIQTLSHLLSERNGVSVIATHSPVVLQEVPKVCVHKLQRSGDVYTARRPRIETYGENVGVLTHEIFGLEVIKSGFYSKIEEAVDRYDTFEEVLAHFNQQLGDEAKGLVRILLADKEYEDD
ncbi:AAA family ATPase [Streptomyces filamentosus]|uniref:AAA family ATPase n=1 Tax=Streptomyces filamentosus TaxID=67294 RepID=UPI00331730A6